MVDCVGVTPLIAEETPARSGPSTQSVASDHTDMSPISGGSEPYYGSQGYGCGLHFSLKRAMTVGRWLNTVPHVARNANSNIQARKKHGNNIFL